MAPDQLVYAIPMAAILLCMAMLLVRAIKGPPVFDRMLALNTFGTKTVLFIAVLGFLNGRPDFLDLALVYALMNFISTIAVLRFSRFGNLARMDEEFARDEDLAHDEGAS